MTNTDRSNSGNQANTEQQQPTVFELQRAASSLRKAALSIKLTRQTDAIHAQIVKALELTNGAIAYTVSL